MMESMYREILEDSPIGYACIKIGDIDDINSMVKIIDMNKHYKRVSKEYDFDIEKLVINNIGFKERLFDLLRKVDEHKKYYHVTYLPNDEINLKIQLYKGNNNEYHFRFDEFSIKESYKLHPIFKNLPFGACIKDMEGKYIDVNEKFLQRVGKSYDEVIGKKNYDIWPQQSVQIFDKQDEIIMKTDDGYSEEALILYNENNEAYSHIIKWPFKDCNNRTIGTVGIGLEINDKIEIRRNIERNEKFFQEISDNIEDVIIIRDRNKAHYISNSFEKVFGCTGERLYNDISLWHDEWENIKLIDGTSNYDELEVVTNTVRVRNNKFDKWISSKFVPIFNANGEVIKKIGVISDITKRKELEEKLESLRMDFLANISHEIRTPITLILSCIQVLMCKIDALKNEEQEYFQKYVYIMKQNSYRLLKLVNNLIDTTKIDSGNFNYKPQNYDIVRFVEDICLSVAEFVQLNNMTIEFDTNEEEKVIGFDLDNMERIVLNLLSNAIKYSKENGKIEVKITCKEDIRISVKDNGLGIPKDKQERVFERFGQVKNKMKTEHEGSGIGLFLVKSLVELNGGEITLNSQLGKGSEFTVILPDSRIEEDESCITIEEMPCKIDKMNVEFSDIYL